MAGLWFAAGPLARIHVESNLAWLRKVPVKADGLNAKAVEIVLL